MSGEPTFEGLSFDSIVGSRGISGAIGGVLALCVFLLLGCSAALGRRAAVPGADGTVYIESNSSRPGSNEVLAFHYRGGLLSSHGIQRYRTHGSGSHDLSNSGVLDSDQELIVNPQRTLLFAVNSSSDTIAVFHIEKGGLLKAVAGSPFPSNGKAPASLGLAGHILIVANKAQDGVRNLSRFHPNYTSFHVRADGSLSAPISTIQAARGSSPLQAYVTPDHKVLITSQESGVFRAFRIGRDGTLTEGPNSPQRLPDRAFAHRRREGNVWPAGLASNPTAKILYAELANASRTVVYRWTDRARLTFVRSMPNRNSFLPCWTEVNSHGTRMYSGNAGSDNVSVFNIAGHATRPKEIQSLKLNAPGNPWDFQIDPTDRVIFLLDMRAVSQIPRHKGNQIHSLRIAPDGRLSEERGSPVKIPVPVGTNPFGLAIVPAQG
jgi:6-phosphogluconolactonase (cycloisomerase 2 family)